MVTVKYWTLREILAEAKRSQGITQEHRDTIKMLEEDMIKRYNERGWYDVHTTLTVRCISNSK
jgi:hypothetical protein